MSRAKSILSLLSKGKSIKEVAKATKSSEAYVYYVRWADKKGKTTPKKKKSKIVKAVEEVKQALDVIEKKNPKADWDDKKAFWKTMKKQYGDATSQVMDELVDPKPLFGEIASDLVNHPPHYTDGGIDTLKFIEAKDLNYRLGNVVKYISRTGKKVDSDPIQDLEKARFYLDREIEARRNA